MNEIWKDVNGFEDYYQVSNYGRVRSKENIVVFSDGRVRTFKSLIRKLSFNKSRGYMYVSLKVNQKTKTYAVHRLVAETFIDRADERLVVDHIDKNRKNNSVENLRWITQRKNTSRNSIDKNGYVGVCWHKDMKKWMSSIYIKDRIVHLGYFNEKIKAINSYKKALRNAEGF